MPHTNLRMPDRSETAERLAREHLVAERDFWRREAERLAGELENIPRAVRQYGFISVPDGGEVMTLVADPKGDEAEKD